MTAPGGESRTVTVRFLAQISGYVSNVKQITQSTRDLRTELTAAAKAGKLDALAGGLTRVGLVATAAFGASIYKMAEFEKQMSEVGSVVGATGDELDALRQKALEAGAATQYSATEAAKAEAELAKAGLTSADILGGALDGALALAAAGSLDLAEAADTAAKAMNIFGLSGQDVTHVADVLAAAANKSATDVHELAFALKMGGLAAKNAGISLEETIGTFAAFADNALAGSDAGTSFKAMLQHLSAPTDQATALMGKLGISAYDAGGNFVGLEKLAANLRRSLGGLTQEQRNFALATIFGADAMRAATVLYSEGGSGIRSYTDAVNDQGAAARAAQQKTDNLMGDIERLTGSLETLFITSGEGANGGLRTLAKTLGFVVDVVGGLSPTLLTTGTVLIGVTGIVALGTAAWVKYTQATATAVATLSAVGPAGARAAAGLKAVTAAAGPLGLLALGVTLTWEGVSQTLASVPLRTRVVTDAIGLMDDKMAELTKAGHGEEAIRKVRETAQQLGLSYQEAIALLPAFHQALLDAGDATAGQASAAQDATVYTLAMGGAFGNAASEVDGLKAAFDRLNGAELDWREAERAAEAAADDLVEKLKESNGSLDVHDAKGRAAAAAVDTLAQAAADAAQAKYDETQNVEAANAVYQQYVGTLHDILAAAGVSEDAIQQLINKIAQMPTYKKVTIDIEQRLRLSGHGFGDLAGDSYIERYGGIVHAAAGMARTQAQIRTRPTVWFAEPETGGEAYIPKRGNLARSMGILSEAAGWYGASVVPRGWTGGAGYPMGGPQQVQLVVSPKPGARRELIDLFSFEVVHSGAGNVQGYMGRRGRVG